jgi:hypothetical protein
MQHAYWNDWYSGGLVCLVRHRHPVVLGDFRGDPCLCDRRPRAGACHAGCSDLRIAPSALHVAQRGRRGRRHAAGVVATGHGCSRRHGGTAAPGCVRIPSQADLGRLANVGVDRPAAARKRPIGIEPKNGHEMESIPVNRLWSERGNPRTRPCVEQSTTNNGGPK